MARLFHIVTIVSDPAKYDAMRTSMAANGYDQSQCRFSRFDNTLENRFEPFSLLKQLASDGDEPVVVLCHQDLLFGPDTSCAVLRRQIETLDSLHPDWAVAGCAGRTVRGEFILHMDDPTGSYRSSPLPRTVLTLDELLLVFPRVRFPAPTPGLSGFHFYGADLAINAWLNRKRSFVIQFPVRHLSAGNFTSDDFKLAHAQMTEVLKQKLLVGLVGTTCDEFVVSCSETIERLLKQVWLARILRRLYLGCIARPRFRSKMQNGSAT